MKTATKVPKRKLYITERINNLLYICATPIGNAEDITLRALRILKECDAVACEDTRHSAPLLIKYGINKPLISYHEHNEQFRSEQLLSRLEQGENIVLISDAGMPCISDPGYVIVQKARERNLPVTVLPGANAGLCALILSGFKCDRFVFEGFLPKSGRERRERIEALKNENRAVILHESPHHLEKTLEELSTVLGERKIAIAREITKIHEECIVFPLNEWKEKLPAVKGEFVLVLSEIEKKEEKSDLPIKEQVQMLTDGGMSKKDAIKQVAKNAGITKNDVYMEVIDL